MARVVQLRLGEGHVADGGIEVVFGYRGLGKGFSADLSAGINGLGDTCGYRVKFDTGHLGALGCQSNESTGSASWFQDTATCEAEVR